MSDTDTAAILDRLDSLQASADSLNATATSALETCSLIRTFTESTSCAVGLFCGAFLYWCYLRFRVSL